MNTAAVTIGIVAMILTFGFGVTITVLVSKSLTQAFQALDKMHARNAIHINDLLDRLMTVRWEDLAALRSAEEPEEGGFIPPSAQKEAEEEEEGGVSEPGWGSLSRLRERMRITSEEEELLREDFSEDFETDEDRRLRQARERGVVE